MPAIHVVDPATVMVCNVCGGAMASTPKEISTYRIEGEGFCRLVRQWQCFSKDHRTLVVALSEPVDGSDA